jgi:hypothetical protein
MRFSMEKTAFRAASLSVAAALSTILRKTAMI